MAGETVTYEVQVILLATCSAEVGPDGSVSRMEGRTEEDIDDAVVGHLIMSHNWTKANAQAYVASKVYTPPTIQDPP